MEPYFRLFVRLTISLGKLILSTWSTYVDLANEE